jgi:predicted transcriptional regulator
MIDVSAIEAAIRDLERQSETISQIKQKLQEALAAGKGMDYRPMGKAPANVIQTAAELLKEKGPLQGPEICKSLGITTRTFHSLVSAELKKGKNARIKRLGNRANRKYEAA